MPDTVYEFHPLTFVPERDGVLVGRRDVESYAVLPEDGAELLRRLAGGMPADQAADWYLTTYGERLDLADFVGTLAELGFLRGDGEAAAAPAAVRYQRLGRAAFSPVAWACYAALVLGAVATMIRDPVVAPRPGNVFFSPSLVVVQLVLIATQFPALLWHEGFHVLAGRRLGLPTRLTIGRRLYFVVFETHLNSLLGVPRRQRYLPFLAGMLADVVLFAALTLAAAACLDGGQAAAGRFILAVAYTTLLRLAWQFFVFLRTDPYYALTTALGCENLADAASAYLRGRLRRLRRAGPAPDAGDWSPRDQALAPWFAWLSVAGVSLLLVFLGFAVVPVAVEFIRRLAVGLAHGTLDGLRFWDAAASLAIIVLQFGIAPLLAGRGGRRAAAAAAKGNLA